MAIKFKKGTAAAILREEAVRSEQPRAVSKEWVTKVERLSSLCEEAGIRTHIAFLGTAMLARSSSPIVDLLAFKPSQHRKNKNSYSARSLCHGVLVPLSAELGFSLGVTGREPLNNQPYFRMGSFGDGTPIKVASREGFEFMRVLVEELQSVDASAARDSLCAFIAVRRRYQAKYPERTGESTVSPNALQEVIRRFVAADSEGGKRAQAVVAGLMDVFAGPERVESGRINDPSRKYPGDVCVRSASIEGSWEKAIEVRDKSVTATDVQLFCKKCVDMGVQEAAVVLASDSQTRLDVEKLQSWANTFGLGLTVFHGWTSFVDQALFWSEMPKPLAASRAVSLIQARLKRVEVTAEAVEQWIGFTCALTPPE